jgi:hypothetical protein
MTIFVQREGSKQIHAVDQLDGLNLLLFKEIAKDNLFTVEEILVFEEGCDEALTEELFIVLLKEKHHPKIHIHRCPKVEVRVDFNGRDVLHRFSPAVTVGTIKAWADAKFEIDAAHAAEHVLQLSGTVERPSASAHIGTLTDGTACSVAFDLVPNERIQG